MHCVLSEHALTYVNQLADISPRHQHLWCYFVAAFFFFNMKDTCVIKLAIQVVSPAATHFAVVSVFVLLPLL